MKNWVSNSWKDFKIKHIPVYSNPDELTSVVETLKKFPPLVFSGEVNSLKKKLASVSKRKAFLLQGGDCAESFAYFRADSIRDTFRVLLQMAVILTACVNKPVVKLGRIAGQFAKPRSSDEEVIDGIVLPSYFGDIINDATFDHSKRSPNPNRMLQAYSQSASTLNLLRAFATGGYADLHHVHSWNMDFVKNQDQGQRYSDLANQIQGNLNFIEALGINSTNTPQLKNIDFFTSHELLLLPYEEALTRLDSTYQQIYDTSAHFLWIGDRTRFLESAHVEFCRGIQNPIGIKCGPSTDEEELVRIIDLINPINEDGKITLITRFGHEKVEQFLPKMIRAIQKEGKRVIWSCDPMHGNAIKSKSGHKTRSFNHILDEVRKSVRIHHQEGTYPGGIHLEMTGKNVTECIGGMNDLSEEDLLEQYETLCDPRLNANQSIELAFLIGDLIKSFVRSNGFE